MNAKLAWIHEKYNHRSETHIGGSSSQTHEIGDVYLIAEELHHLTAEELHQLHLDEEALRKKLEEQTMDEKAREEKIRQKQAIWVCGVMMLSGSMVEVVLWWDGDGGGCGVRRLEGGGRRRRRWPEKIKERENYKWEARGKYGVNEIFSTTIYDGYMQLAESLGKDEPELGIKFDGLATGAFGMPIVIGVTGKEYTRHQRGLGEVCKRATENHKTSLLDTPPNAWQDSKRMKVIESTSIVEILLLLEET
ncbi:hypothetical protein Tco_0393745, partial [Tanacetum coccineum]